MSSFTQKTVNDIISQIRGNKFIWKRKLPDKNQAEFFFLLNFLLILSKSFSLNFQTPKTESLMFYCSEVVKLLENTINSHLLTLTAIFHFLNPWFHRILLHFFRVLNLKRFLFSLSESIYPILCMFWQTSSRSLLDFSHLAKMIGLSVVVVQYLALFKFYF